MQQLMAGIKPKAVLAVLLINRDRVVSSAAIAEAIWNDNVPTAYTASLQVFMSTLRRSLRDLCAGGNVLITTQAPGYRLTVDGLCVDLGRFERARTVGNEQFAGKRYVDAAAHYRAALAEWSGPALADLRGYRFADDFAAAVEEDRLATLQSRIEADLACGRDAAVIGELTTLTAQHPLREPFWAQLMTAYYRVGRQADALEAGRRIRALLNAELGIDPSPAIQDLERRILRQESLWELAAGEPPVGMLQTMTETNSTTQRCPVDSPDRTSRPDSRARACGSVGWPTTTFPWTTARPAAITPSSSTPRRVLPSAICGRRTARRLVHRGCWTVGC